ncbi:MAG: glycine zipper 2TM domain-containing protein [Magnetococcales bacterium]|nr:glycine zipper 2TM domain-containing protein [Magnetococcales bacterium]
MKRYGVVVLVVTGWVAVPMPLGADSGAAVGALSGALIGSLSGPVKNRVENSLIGAVAGGLLGSAIGSGRAYHGPVVVQQSLEYAPSYQTATWVHPESRVAYVVTPRPASTLDGRVCREVEIQGVIDARRDTLTGLACRDGAGHWRLVDRVSVVTAPAPLSPVVVSRPVTRYTVVEPAPVYSVPTVVYPVPLYYPNPVVVYRERRTERYYQRPHRHDDRGWGERRWRHPRD